jgi:hypothetical protein
MTKPTFRTLALVLSLRNVRFGEGARLKTLGAQAFPAQQPHLVELQRRQFTDDLR